MLIIHKSICVCVCVCVCLFGFMLKSLWLDHYWIIIMFLARYAFGNSSSNPNWWCVAFYFLNNHVRKCIMAIHQDDNIKMHQAQLVKEWLGASKKMCLRRLYWLLDSPLHQFSQDQVLTDNPRVKQSPLQHIPKTFNECKVCIHVQKNNSIMLRVRRTYVKHITCINAIMITAKMIHSLTNR